MEALECVVSKIRFTTLTNTAVEIDAAVSAAVVEVGDIRRGEILANNDNGLPEVNISGVDSTTCDLPRC